MKFKRILPVLISCLCALALAGCHYNPPAGYTRSHQSYEDLVAYAQSIDPNATVTNTPQDVKDDYWEYRIYPAVIGGKDCNVASASDTVYDSDLGEFARTYYKPDTDYDYYVICDLLNNYPELGTVDDDTESMRFQVNDIIYTEIEVQSLTESEFDELFERYTTFYAELDQNPYPIHKTFYVSMKIGGKTYSFTKPTQEEKQKVLDKLKKDGIL